MSFHKPEETKLLEPTDVSPNAHLGVSASLQRMEYRQTLDVPYREIHHMDGSNTKIDFRPLQVSDKSIVRCLHEKWFPVKYSDEFYEALVQNKLVGSDKLLFSCVAFGKNEAKGSNDIENEQIKDEILGCIVGSFVETSQCKPVTADLLIRNQQKYTRMFYIMTLGIIDEYRKRGLGTVLVNKVIKLAENDSKCGALYLHVITFNLAAIRFYERLGFYRVKEIKDYYFIDGEYHNCYLYARYFHGNWGHHTVFKVVSSFIASVLNKIKRAFQTA